MDQAYEATTVRLSVYISKLGQPVCFKNSISQPDWKVKNPDNQDGEDKCLSHQEDDVKGGFER
jgi:hypothetical protein